MTLDKDTISLVAQLEQIVGSSCYNPNSYDGYTGETGRSYRYPVKVRLSEDHPAIVSYKHTIPYLHAQTIPTMKYTFGSNHLFIGDALVKILNLLEERYDLDFNELEENRKNI